MQSLIAYHNNVGNTLTENRVGGPVNSRDSSLGVIDDPHNGTANGDSAVSSLARICRKTLSTIPSQSFRGRKQTELNKGSVKPRLAGVENSSDLVVGTADESSRRDGGGQSHSTAGEDREDSGESHFD